MCPKLFEGYQNQGPAAQGPDLNPTENPAGELKVNVRARKLQDTMSWSYFPWNNGGKIP